MKNDPNYTQLCVWPGCVLGLEKITDFEISMFEQFKVRVKYETEILTNPTPGLEGTGGRNDLFFYIHTEDIHKFAIQRLAYEIRWWEDVLDNQQSYLYPIKFLQNHPKTW